MFESYKFSLPRIAALSPILALLLAGATAKAQVISDVEVPFSQGGLTYSGPEGIAVYAADGTVYVADTGNTRVVRISPTGLVTGTSKNAGTLGATVAALTIKSGTTTLKPSAVAVGSNGVLYVADYSGHHVAKVATPEVGTTPTATLITYGTGTEYPTALAVDPSNNLYIADWNNNAIYESVAGGTPATKVTLTVSTGATLYPVGLTTDASGNVYIANATSTASTVEIYVYKPGTTPHNTTPYIAHGTGNFDFEFPYPTEAFGVYTGVAPTGMGFDPAGNFYVMDSGQNKLIEVTSSANFLVPFTTGFTANPGSFAVGSTGNLFLDDDNTFDDTEAVDELFYNNNPVNLNSIAAATESPTVSANFEFNTALPRGTTLTYFQSVWGENTGELNHPGGGTPSCTTTAGSLCTITYAATYLAADPGLRSGVFGISDSNGNVYAVPSIGIGLEGNLALYPGTQYLTSQNETVNEPQSLVATGNGKYMFVADEGATVSGGEYSYSGRVLRYTSSNGAWSTIGTAGTTFPTPTAVALDSAGNLYVGDYSGTIYVVTPTWSGTTASWGSEIYTLSVPNVTFYHPMSIAMDPSNNLYIGDMGSAGVFADATTPGFIVKIPVGSLSCSGSTCSIGGGAATVNYYKVGGIPVVFPQSLTTDVLGNLFIADGGDGNEDQGGLDAVTASTNTVTALNLGSYTPNQPTGLDFDAANDLYIVDGYNQRILVAAIGYSGGTPTVSTIGPLGQGNSGGSGITATLVTPVDLLVWPTGQQITIADIGYLPLSGAGGSPAQLVTLLSTNESVTLNSGSIAFSGVNVGSETINFTTPTHTGSGFTFSGCASATGTLLMGISYSCSPTITRSGTGTSTETFTIRGNLGYDNTITATATGSDPPQATLTGPGFSFGQTVTDTLSDTGENLTIDSISVSGGTRVGGTCPSSGTLLSGKSCTIEVNVSGTYECFLFFCFDYGEATVTVTDNSAAPEPQTLTTIALW